MPSDAKKRQLQKKKDAAKARQNIKPAGSKTENGDENVPISEEGNFICFKFPLFIISIIMKIKVICNFHFMVLLLYP